MGPDTNSGHQVWNQMPLLFHFQLSVLWKQIWDVRKNSYKDRQAKVLGRACIQMR